MSTSLQLGRDLREMSFAAAVGAVVKIGATGVLELQDTLGVNRAFFVNGRPQGARLARMKHPIGRLIVDEGLVTEIELNRALSSQRSHHKLLGQSLIELGFITEDALDALVAKQSRLNFFSMFSARDGRLAFKEGAVHLTNFAPAPLPPTAGIYFGLCDANRLDAVNATLAPLLTVGLQLSEGRDDVLEELPPAECFAVETLRSPKFAGEVARAVPLPSTAVSFLLFALHANAALHLLPAKDVPR